MRIRVLSALAIGQLVFCHPPQIAGAQDHAPAATCQRLVEFRDGSILLIDLPADYQFHFRQTSTDSGDDLSTSTFRLDEPVTIRFSKLPALKQLRTIQNAVAALTSENFKLREQALRTLLTGGQRFPALPRGSFHDDQRPGEPLAARRGPQFPPATTRHLRTRLR